MTCTFRVVSLSVVTALFSLSSLAQTPPGKGPTPVDPAVTACRSAALANIQETIEIGRAAVLRGDLSDSETPQFYSAVNRLELVKPQLTSAPQAMTLPICQRIAADVAKEKALVVQMSTPDPKLAECRTANAASVKQFNDMYAQIKAVGLETAEFLKLYDQLNPPVGGRLQEDTLGNCSVRSRMIASALPKIRAAQVDPRVLACIAQNQESYSALVVAYNKAKASGDITFNEAQQFGSIDASMKNTELRLKASGLTLSECQSLTAIIVTDRAAVDTMVAVLPELAACRSARQTTVQGMLTDWNKFNSGPNLVKLNNTDKAKFVILGENINISAKAISTDLGSCKRMTSEVQPMRSELNRLIR